VGEHIAFGPGEYRPGTIEGDTLLAHELAHVAQQGGPNAHSSPAGDSALERDADASAESVIGRLWNGVKRRVFGERGKGPRLRSGLRLQRKVVNYHLQGTSGFSVCIYCICAREDVPEKFVPAPSELTPGQTCPPGVAIDWVPGWCGNSRRSTTWLTADPCPESHITCR
jgi:hypothetical protein